mmetsp:Transcript_15562/g.29356  ORF Transcript_15562/g.29356 Transcript_15562/m.29356 type:complete len:617 (-) Transcript_15562:38-1888(-)
MSNVYGFDFLRSEHVSSNHKTTPLHTFENISQKEEETLQDDFAASPELTTTATTTTYHEKTDLEKQFDVIQFLQNHRSSGCLPPSIIYKSINVDLSEGGRDENVTKLLLKNARIKVEEIPDPENPTLTILTFGYQAKFNNVRNRTGLIAQVNRAKNGIRRRDLLDSYEGIEEDIDQLITSGDVIAVLNSEDKDKILFPRGESFLVELDGIVNLEEFNVQDLIAKYTPKQSCNNNKVTSTAETTTVTESTITATATATDPTTATTITVTASTSSSTTVTTTTKVDDEKGSLTTVNTNGLSEEIQKEAIRKAKMEIEKSLYFAKIDVNPKYQIRRGEAIWVGGQWFRVSSAVREGVPLSEQPAKAQAPLSVTSRKDMSKKNEVEGYIRKFDVKTIPLDHKMEKETVENLQSAKEALKNLYEVASKYRGSSGKPQKGPGAQLLSSNATAGNPEELATAFACSVSSSMNFRKRPMGNRNGMLLHHPDAKRVAEDVEITKKVAMNPNLVYARARRHGCTVDVRDLYLATREEIPPPEQEVDIYNMLVKYKLLEADEPMKRPRMSRKNMMLDENGKPKKRRYYERKGQRMTNTHLIGTEIGQALAAAAEKQQQGKSVGDGGM